MEIILKKDVEKLGYADDVVKVKNGYALNYLIPQGYAVVANDTNRKVLKQTIKMKEIKEEKMLAQISEIKAKIGSLNLKIGAKTGTTGKIFGSVSAFHIADAIKKATDIDVDRRKITIVEGEVKTLGNYTAEVGIGKDHKVNVAFEVVAE